MRNASCFAASIIVCVLSGHAIAETISSEDFESYALGALNGGLGGSGWSNPWSSNSNVNVISGGLSYSNGPVIVNGGTQAVEIAFNPAEGNGITNGILSRSLASVPSETIYMSMLFRDTANSDLATCSQPPCDFVQWGFDDGTANPQASIMRRNGTFQARSTINWSLNSVDSGIAAQLEETFLLVFKAEKSATNYDSISLFVNPDSLTEPGTASAVSSVDSGLSSLDNFVSRSAYHELNDAFQLDHIQIGTQWEDVVATVPEPASVTVWMLVGLVVVSCGCRRRRKH